MKLGRKDIEELITVGEGQSVEFKSRFPLSPEIIIRAIGAMANTEGGTILIGVGDKGEILGMEESKIGIGRAQELVQYWSKRLNPAVYIATDVVDIEGKDILAIRVPKSEGLLHFEEGKVFLRERCQVRLAQVSDIRNMHGEGMIQSYVDQLVSIIGNLRNDLETANSWRNRAKDYIIGGIVGAIISFAIGHLSQVGNDKHDGY